MSVHGLTYTCIDISYYRGSMTISSPLSFDDTFVEFVAVAKLSADLLRYLENNIIFFWADLHLSTKLRIPKGTRPIRIFDIVARYWL